jgi:transcriptional regulator with XRE-family HTH domain
MSKELREFLASRRARMPPEQAGLPRYGARRRVPGLRREEVASLSGVSAEWYAKLERGTATGVSDGVLDAIARTLQLDEAERTHLYDLVRASTPAGRTRRRTVPARVRPGVQQLLDAMTGVPALVQNERFDVLAASPLGRALYADIFAGAGGSGQPPNLARFAFLDPRAHEFYPDWDRVASDAVALLRAAAGRSPDDRALSDLVGELTTRSDRFSTLWASYNIRAYPPGTKRFHHRDVGDLELAYEALALTFDPGQVLVAYTAEPNSASHHALTILASWTAIQPAATQTEGEVDGAAHAR